jgi:hypothetical protein
MHVVRTFRMAAAVAAASLVVGALGTGAAEARPVKPGPVTGLAATASEPSIGTYHVHVTWNAASNATSYQASIVRAGTTIASTKVSTTSWDVDVAGKPGQVLTVNVRGIRTHFKGKNASTTVPLTDHIAPSATYTSSWNNSTGVATLTEVGLKDDSALSGVIRTVDWGDGSAPDTYLDGDPITNASHPYPLTAMRYVPKVTLEDAAHNTREVDAAAVVINDTEAPVGSFTNGNTTAWAKLTKVRLSQTALSDNWTPADLITRVVAWGDGKTSTWTKGTTISHVYVKGGTFTPKVTITDEAHNSATVSTSAVRVKVDKTGPKLTVALGKPRHSVKAWQKLHGRATDTGTGVKTVSLKAIEKRKGHWYGYNAKTHRWVKAATKAKAFARSKALTRTTNSHHRWTAKLRGLRKGKLVVRAWAVDRVGNHSATVTRMATLTHR